MDLAWEMLERNKQAVHELERITRRASSKDELDEEQRLMNLVVDAALDWVMNRGNKQNLIRAGNELLKHRERMMR